MIRMSVFLGYAIAVAFWNTVYSIAIFGLISLIACISETDTLNLHAFLVFYFISYIILFVFNLGMLKNYLREKEGRCLKK